MGHQFKLTPQKTDNIQTPNREIKSYLPCPSSIDYINKLFKYEPLSMNNQIPVLWDRAEGFNVWDLDGNKFIDLTSTIFVANAGHGIGKNSLLENIQKPLLNSYYYPTVQRAKFSEFIIENLIGESYNNNFKKVLFLSTGSEAMEASMKMAKLNFINKKGNYENYIFGFENSFHGKTLGSQMAGGKTKDKKWLEKSTEGGYFHLPYPYPWILKEKNMNGEEFFHESISKISEEVISKISAFVFEPYQGWCAVFFPKDYMQSLYKFCKKNDILLISDEIQSGFGRTGKLFAFEHYDIIPDMIVCGKAISGNLPVSAVISREDLFGTDESFNSTHGGNPLAMSSALENLKFLLDNDLVKKSEELGNYLFDYLGNWKKEEILVTDFYSKGLLASVFLKSPIPEINNIDFVDDIIERAYRKGVISIRTCSGTLKIGPPLIITKDALTESLDIYKECIKDFKNEYNIS
jgi:4-aminobutyrate aminotransferase/(S)-3-amino-2-methylpropionate transaminase